MEKVKIKINKHFHEWQTTNIATLVDKLENNVFVPIFPFTNCRSFISDALYYRITGKANTFPGRTTPYYFLDNDQYNYKTGNTYTTIKFENIETKNTFINNLPWLNKKEKLAKVTKTTIKETQNPIILIISGSKWWKRNVWKIQLYTFYLKCMCYENPKTCDVSYWKTLTPNKENILLNQLKNIEEDFSSIGNNIHSSSGPIAICSGENKTMAKILGIGKKLTK